MREDAQPRHPEIGPINAHRNSGDHPAMNSRGKEIVILLYSFAIAACIAAPVAAQAGRDKPAVERTPGRLWRLYPLDPEAGGKDQIPQTGNEVPAPGQTTFPDDVESRRQPEGAPNESAGSSALTVAITLACAAALSIILLLRRAGWGATKPEVRIRAQAPEEPSAPAAPELSLVRVHLRDGRKMEGAVKHVATQDSSVLLLDVVDISDAEGQKREPQPIDAFVPLVEVERIESIDEKDSHRDDARGRPQ
jgi:hypothetical protein